MAEKVKRFELLFDSIKNRSNKWRTLAAEKRKSVGAALIEAGCNEVPRNLREIAEQLGIDEVREVPLAIRGRLVRERAGLAIEINCDLPVFDKRHVFAHELAHVLLEENNFESSQRSRSQLHNSSYRVVEKLCDDCAGEILLPVSWLREQLRYSRPSMETLVRVATHAECSPEFAAERLLSEGIWQCTFLVCEVKGGRAWIVRSYPQEAANSLLLELCKNTDLSPIVQCFAKRRQSVGSESLRFGEEVIVERVECFPLAQNAVLAMITPREGAHVIRK